jgi:hypothetical protein
MKETGFLERLCPTALTRSVVNGKPCIIPLGTPASRGWKRRIDNAKTAFTYLSSILQVARPHIVPRLTYAKYLQDFGRYLDDVAQGLGKIGWLEKTPNHLFYLEMLEQHLPNCRFVHILRNGEDVVASCVDASIQYANRIKTWTFHQSVPWFVAYWNASVLIHSQFANRPNHLYVFYEDLVRDIPTNKDALSRFLKISSVVPVGPVVTAQIADLQAEPWKENSLSEELRPGKRKFEQLFGPDLQDWIRENLMGYENVIRNIKQAQSQNKDPAITS